MVGLGETFQEVVETMRDLREAGVRILTIGQYLQPTAEHYPVAEYITPQQFDDYKAKALELGFDYCASAPLVRSSYLADEAAKVVFNH
jgi:lipoic acid synthetase